MNTYSDTAVHRVLSELDEPFRDHLVALRRWLHQHPELSFQEVETAKRIMQELDDLGIRYKYAGVGHAVIGYIDGETIQYEYDGPAGYNQQLDMAAARMVARGVKVIFTSSTPATLAAKRATIDIPTPIIFGPVNDPVRAGVVDTLIRPGGNITGVMPPPSGGRRMQWMSEIAPHVRLAF